MLPIKNNLVLPTGGLAFRVNEATSPLGNHVPWLVWDPHRVTVSADVALAASNELPVSKPAGDGGAVHFIIDEIDAAGGKIESKDIEKAAQNAGLSKRTLDRAKCKLKVVASREGFGTSGKWFWSLPKEPHRTPLGDSGDL